MLIAFWIVAGLTAFAFLAIGLMKLVRSTDALRTSGLGWVDDFPAPAVKLIGLAEVLGAIGLVVPVLVHVAPILSPIAGICLAALMVGALVVHLRRHEPPVPVAFILLSAASAVLGFIAVA